LGGRKGIRPVKNRVVGYWRGYQSGARCRLAYGPADALPLTALAPIKSRLVLPFWYRLSQVVLEKRPLNGCSSSSSNVNSKPNEIVVIVSARAIRVIVPQ